MTMTGISRFDHARRGTAGWLDLMRDDLWRSGRDRVRHLLRQTLLAVRDVLTAEQAADHAARLALPIRGVFFDGRALAGTPTGLRSVEDFPARVMRSPSDGPPVKPAVPAVLPHQTGRGQSRRALRETGGPSRALLM